MNMKKVEEFMKRKYTPKEALAYFVISVNKTTDTNVDKLVDTLIKELIQSNDRKELMNKLKLATIEKIINYWNLSMEQVIAYSHIVFNNIIFEEKPLTEEKITDMFVYVMRLYSPDNAVEFVNNNIIK